MLQVGGPPQAKVVPRSCSMRPLWECLCFVWPCASPWAPYRRYAPNCPPPAQIQLVHRMSSMRPPWGIPLSCFSLWKPKKLLSQIYSKLVGPPSSSSPSRLLREASLGISFDLFCLVHALRTPITDMLEIRRPPPAVK